VFVRVTSIVLFAAEETIVVRHSKQHEDPFSYSAVP